jgi:DNA-binding CsgD family transcriptional regulator
VPGIDRLGRGWWAGCVAGLVGFVGRERELSCLAGALGGDARLVLVVGDAGVGKTRFAQEGMRRAVAGGMVCVFGGCLPLAGELPLLPVADALGELGRLDGGAQLEAGLAMAPPYVRAEIARLLPRFGAGVPGPGGRGEGWQREQLFSALAELLGAVAQRSGLAVVVEDVHWADGATLDCLTYLVRAGGGGALAVVVTCRSDDAPLDAQVAAWLAHTRGRGGVEEIRLGPLTRGEAEQQIAGLAGGPPPAEFADDVYARAEGNPFFTEQLVAAALADPAGGGLDTPAGLPDRLAELLLARAGRCGGNARAVLAGLAVAGRPLTEDMLAGITGLELDAVRGGLRDLASARLLAADSRGGGHRPRHALLAEAVAADMLAGERIVLHERTARALEEAADDALAAEAATHWAAARRTAEELRARVTAAGAAEGVFGYAEAAAQLQRAIGLCQAAAGDVAAAAAGIDVPRMYVRAIDALEMSGDIERAAAMAEEAYSRFTGHPDSAIVAVITMRAAFFRGIGASPGGRAAGWPLIKDALRLFAQAPPSADHAEAWFHYANIFLRNDAGQLEASRTALDRALEIAEAAGATAMTARIMPIRAIPAFDLGLVEEGFAVLQRARDAAEASGDGVALLRVALSESDALLGTGQFQEAAEVALRGLRAARQAGLQAWLQAIVLTAHACEGLLACGRTAEAAALIDPLTTGLPERDDWIAHDCRAEIDLLRGDSEAATRRRQLVKAWADNTGNIEWESGSGQKAAELALWARRPGDALEGVQRVLALFTAPELTIFCSRLLTVGIWACADLAEQARARRDEAAAAAALAAAGGLAEWAARMDAVPFTDHPFVATIPAERAIWDAERTRLAGESDPAAWDAAAKAWADLGCPHRAGYAWWRQAEAQLGTGQPATAAAGALQAAAAAADGHAPLLAQIRALAERARIPLQVPPTTRAHPPSGEARVPYGLTERELTVLRLLTAGRTNAQIGAELFISPKTAGVHVTNILRKLGVANRVQAAALAERAGLAHTGQA